MNTETTHTPGPLTVSVDSTRAERWAVCKSHGHQPNAEQAGVGHVVATARCYHEADARLYAAAPDLLAALEELLEAAAGPLCHSHGAQLKVARYAKAKAKGQGVPAQANASLIAAAPELLEALETVQQVAAMSSAEQVSCEQMGRALVEIEKPARAAIAIAPDGLAFAEAFVSWSEKAHVNAAIAGGKLLLQARQFIAKAKGQL